MQTSPTNSLTTPVALIIVALALVISTLIFVFAGNSEAKEETPGLATNPVAIMGSQPEHNREFNQRPQPNFERHARPRLGKLRAFIAGSKPPFLKKGNPGLDGKKQGNTKPRYSGKGNPGLDGKKQGNTKPRFSGKGKPGLGGERQGNAKPRFSDKGKRGLDGNRHRPMTQKPESQED